VAGTIEVRPKAYWSSSSFLFYWVLEDLAATVKDPSTVRKLEEIVREHLGFLAIHQLPEPGRAEVVEAIGRSLVEHRDHILPADLPNREGDLRLVRELVDLTRNAPEGNLTS
jgi:hypothetical protein